MNVAVNGRFLARRVTGVERYGREVLSYLGNRLRVVCPDYSRVGLRGHAWEQTLLPQRLRSNEILWSPANTGPLSVANQILTIHDLSPLEHPEWYTAAFSWWYRWVWPVLVRRVKRIVTPSEAVRKKVMARFALCAEHVVAIPEGVDMQRFRPGTASKQKMVLFVGSLAPRKNLVGLLRAWELIEHKYPAYALVIAGTPGNIFRSIAWPARMTRVHRVGYISESDLPALYAAATLFILPSLDEGFGLPVLEAMASGTPVIVSRAGALPEVIGAAGLLFDPHDVTDIAATLDHALSDAALRDDLCTRGLAHAAEFSWRVASEKIWQVLQS